MNFMALEALRAFVEGGSIAEASLRIHRSPSQVSRLLAMLEEEAGFPLLLKEGRRLSLTEQGQGFYQRIDEMLRAGDAVREYARGARRKSRTHVNVLVAQHLIEGLLVDAVAGAVQEDNAFGVTINARMPPNVDAWISQQQFDLALAQLPVEHPLLTTEILAESRAVAVLSGADPRAGQAVITPRILGQGRFIGLPQRGALHHRYARAFAQAGYGARCPVRCLVRLHRLPTGGARLRRGPERPAVGPVADPPGRADPPLRTGNAAAIWPDLPQGAPPSPAAQLLIRHLRAVAADKLRQVETLVAAAPADGAPKPRRRPPRGA
ncbi:LysR family transcriptional regulator [Achromobacter insuavis]